ncbi:uncharacterized protein A4U43_C06F18180 [Asparagus officinalis]|uniref:EF-hand domain-containing protein n=1 Tax=Asparagus officinalis TaxID=4686 RepID=A0A5P1ER19_ASPOF|nr:calcium-binding protein SPEC 2C-like [Asparagus officinalis]ONK67249.1 uncharacterized protein A4U43_C06F18180 [Asparagus officinalis]
MPFNAPAPAHSRSGVTPIKLLERRSIDRGKMQMTREEFKKWLESMDGDGDGQVSKSELRAALKGLGMHFTRWKTWRAMSRADLNHNKKVDSEQEIDELIKYAAIHWGILVV